MRHTLIPATERLILHREYHVRVAIVTLCILSLAILIGCAALLPAYLRAWSASRSALDTVASVKSDPSANNLASVERVLSSDDALLLSLQAGIKAPKLSDAVGSIANIHSPVTINSFTINRLASSTVAVTLSGIAPTRDDLLKFQTRLETLAPNTSVNLPIGELAKSVDVPYSLQFTESLP